MTTAAFKIDLATHRVTARGAGVRLTPTEWRLLDMLVRDPGRLTQRQVLQQVWGPT